MRKLNVFTVLYLPIEGDSRFETNSNFNDIECIITSGEEHIGMYVIASCSPILEQYNGWVHCTYWVFETLQF